MITRQELADEAQAVRVGLSLDRFKQCSVWARKVQVLCEECERLHVELDRHRDLLVESAKALGEIKAKLETFSKSDEQRLHETNVRFAKYSAE